MGKIEGWEGRLIAEVESWQGVPFKWGGADCFDFVIACEIAVTGETRFVDLPGYRTPRGFLRQMRKFGFQSVEDGLDHWLTGCPVLTAQRGDWVMRADPAFEICAMGVVLGGQVAYRSMTGLTIMPITTAECAWRIA